MKNQRKAEKKLEVLMRTIRDNFSFFFTPENILVIHLFVGQLSAWSFPRLVLLFQNCDLESQHSVFVWRSGSHFRK